jgi:hypothetical protein
MAQGGEAVERGVGGAISGLVTAEFARHVGRHWVMGAVVGGAVGAGLGFILTPLLVGAAAALVTEWLAQPTS